MSILTTNRLILTQLALEDAPFILELLNDPDFLKYIGDKGVRNLEDARQYILNGPVASYEQHGFGLWLTKRKECNTPIGICGLLKRETLEDVDIGFAFLPEYRGQGYGYESASAVMIYGQDVLGLERIVAITSPENDRSIQLLNKLGLHSEKMIRLSEDGDECLLLVPAPSG